jgi:hypothetical protein
MMDGMSDGSSGDQLPESLTLEQAYRAAFYMVEQYIDLEKNPDVGLVLLLQYMESDPARWVDWVAAVKKGLRDSGVIDPHA